MKKVIVILFAVSLMMGAGLAHATPKLAGLSNVGSVLIFPEIDTTSTVQDEGGDPPQETFIMIENDNNQPVTIKCEWVIVQPGAITPLPGCDRTSIPGLPPKQTGLDFVVTLTPFQPLIFAASNGFGLNAQFTTINPFGVGNVGYLACWAVDTSSAQNQISFNHLSGSAIVSGLLSGYQYPAWAAQAQNVTLGASIGTPGLIKFDAVEYDALPNYLLFEFPTLGVPTTLSNNPGLFFQDLDLSLVQGRQDFTTLSSAHYVTGVAFDTWNENEVRYSGASTCVWCFYDDFLDQIVTANNNQFFTAANLLSTVAKFRITGAQANGCNPVLGLSMDELDTCFPAGFSVTAQPTPLLGIAVQYLGLIGASPDPNGAGAPSTYATTNLPLGVAQDFTGFIKWHN